MARPVKVSRLANFGECSIFKPISLGFEEISSHYSAQFFFAFNWSPLMGKPRMIPLFFVKITESYNVSYGSGILRPVYGII